MQPKTFGSLPPELRDAIWRLAIPSTTFHINMQIKRAKWPWKHTQCSITATPDVKHRNNVLLVCKESSAAFKSVKKVRVFNPVGKYIEAGSKKKWELVVNPINLDPFHDTIDFSAHRARVSKFVEAFPELASCINAAVIPFREIPAIWWIVAIGLPRVETLAVVVTGSEERSKLVRRIEHPDLQVSINLSVDRVIQRQVSRKTMIYSKMESGGKFSDRCGEIITELPAFVQHGS